MKRSTYHKSENRATRPLELVHSDIVGKLENSYNDFNFFLTLMDDYSRYAWIYLLRKKSDASNKIKDFNELMKNTTGYSIKTLKTDNGREYVNDNLYSYLNKNGIKIIHSIPGCPEQNGRAERLNQTLDNCAKTLLNWAKLPSNFWDMAILCACRLYNYNPHSAINYNIPFELFFNKKCDFSYLKVFGCKVYFYDNHKKGKFTDNAKPGIFLGYPANSLGYRVLDIETNSIITIRDGYFIEHLPGTVRTTFYSDEVIQYLFPHLNSQIEEENSKNAVINETINNNNIKNTQFTNLNEENITKINSDNSSINITNNEDKRENIKNNNTYNEQVNKTEFLYINTKIPKNYKEAIESKDSIQWKEAIKKELDNMYNQKVMKIVNTLPNNANIIDTKWVFTTKENNIKKARLVARGFQQIKNVDYTDTYSPTVQTDTLRITISIAASKGWNLRQMDIKAAYLNAPLKEEIYTKIPIGDKNYNKNKYWLLTKALYGLKQAGRAWFKEISNYLKEINLKQFKTDKCLFAKYKNNKLTALVTLYVDDILITGEDREIKIISDKLKDKYKISMDKAATKIVGINIIKTKDGYKINQTDYIEKLIQNYNMNKTKNIYTPCRNIDEKERENSPQVDVTEYKSLIGALLYLSTKTRPDIAFAVNKAARNAENPTKLDLISAMQILQYIKTTKDKSIIYNKELKFSAYSDADFANDNTRKSTTGYIILNGSSPVSWKAQLQKNITLSTAEAEFVSLTECIKQINWLRNLLKEIFNLNFKININVDNMSCIKIAEDENYKGRCKHMDIKYKYIQECIKDNKIKLTYKESNKMLADPLTKCISGPQMKKFTDFIFN